MAASEVSPVGRVSAFVQVLLGIFGVLVEKITFYYFWLFYSGVVENVSIDRASSWHHPGLLHPSPLINNSLLLLLFCLPHSVLARKWIKNLVSFLFSESFYRCLFLSQSSLCLFLLCYGWTPQPSPALWDFQFTPVRLTLYGVCFLGLMMNIAAFFSLPVLDFIGIREPLEVLGGKRLCGSEGDLVTSGMYGIVRHPMYTGLLTIFWFHPTMSMSRLMIAAVLTFYIVVAILLFEEPSLMAQFGDSYREYMKTTPMLFPLPHWRLYKQKNQ